MSISQPVEIAGAGVAGESDDAAGSAGPAMASFATSLSQSVEMRFSFVSRSPWVVAPSSEDGEREGGSSRAADRWTQPRARSQSNASASMRSYGGASSHSVLAFEGDGTEAVADESVVRV
jgi:hypothetical protein